MCLWGVRWAVAGSINITTIKVWWEDSAIWCNSVEGGERGFLYHPQYRAQYLCYEQSQAALLSVLTQLPQRKHWEQLCRHRWVCVRACVCMCVRCRHKHTHTRTNAAVTHPTNTSAAKPWPSGPGLHHIEQAQKHYLGNRCGPNWMKASNSSICTRATQVCSIDGTDNWFMVMIFGSFCKHWYQSNVKKMWKKNSLS